MEKVFFAKIELWVVGLLAVLFALGALAFGYLVADSATERSRFGGVSDAALTLAEAPETLRDMMREDTTMMAFNRRRFPDREGGWSPVNADAAEGLEGYFLLSRHDGDAVRHRVSLIDLSDFSVVHEWLPDADRLLDGADRSSEVAELTLWNTARFRAIHPLLMDNGDLIIKDHQTPLMRIDACGKMLWRNDEDVFHHSTEPASDGNIWVPTSIEPSPLDVPADFADDAVTLVSPEGEILLQHSVTEALINAGHTALVFTAGAYHRDPVHLNDIEEVPGDGPFWQAGDVFLSLRHLSMVMLYRPSTGEIPWMKQGPWIAQHDVDIVNDTTIAVFSNNSVDRGKGGRVQGVSEVLHYDFATDIVTSPYRAALEGSDVKTLFEGLADRTTDGHLIVEEENSGRIVILSPDGTMTAEFINRASDGNLYRLGWSRYVPPDTAEPAVTALAAATCVN